MLRLRSAARYRVVRPSLKFLFKSSAALNGVAIRNYASPSVGKKREEVPSFKKIFLVAILGTLVFVQAANSLEKNKPKTSYSEEEFENVMSGLKRRVSLFPAGSLRVKLVPNDSILDKVRNGEEVVIDPKKVVEFYRSQKDGTYEALLNELKSKNGPDYIEKLPRGMLVTLIGKYMKEKCQNNDEVIISDFPHSIKDAIKFENDVCTVDKVVIDKANSNSDVCQYYATVQKVEEV